MLSKIKMKKEPSVMTPDQLEVLMESHRNFQDYIDLANKMRKTYKGKDINYFEQFFLKATKHI